MAIKCPKCKADFQEDADAEVTLTGFVDPSHDFEGKARADLILECSACGSRWNTFVSLEDFYCNPVAEGC